MVKEIVNTLELKDDQEIDQCNFSLYLYCYSFDPSIVWKNSKGFRIENPYKEVAKLLIISYACEENCGAHMMNMITNDHPVIPMLNARLMETDDPPIDGFSYELYHENAYNEALNKYDADRFTHLDLTFLQQAYAEEEFAFATQIG